ncbi:MAG TPA: hypothetical protein P5519_00340 [Spirochaetia bacterium]|nr:hypothetical protein [Spirochaetia bacterium]
MGCFGSSNPNQQLLNSAIAGKTPDQVKVLKYFLKPEGCMSKNMSDDEYFSMVIAKRDALNLKARALGKIGLDEDELQEIPPVMFEGFTFQDAWAKKRANGNWVSSSYQISWLFFSTTQVYLYQYVIYMDEDKKREYSEEYFYKDVTNFSTRSETEKTKGTLGNSIEVETTKFALVVPGATLTVAIEGSKNFEDAIQAMKQKLREKKMQ